MAHKQRCFIIHITGNQVILMSRNTVVLNSNAFHYHCNRWQKTTDILMMALWMLFVTSFSKICLIHTGNGNHSFSALYLDIPMTIKSARLFYIAKHPTQNILTDMLIRHLAMYMSNIDVLRTVVTFSSKTSFQAFISLWVNSPLLERLLKG